jgi:hypothetical protein
MLSDERNGQVWSYSSNAYFTLKGVFLVREDCARSIIKASCDVWIIKTPACHINDLASSDVTGVVVHTVDDRDCLGNVTGAIVVRAVKSLSVQFGVSYLP